MSLIPEGYDLIAEGICSFSDSDKTYNGIWYHYEEDNSYYFCLGYDVNLDIDEEDEIEIYPVEEENMVCDDDQTHGWFSKTMEEYSFVDLESDIEEEDNEDLVYNVSDIDSDEEWCPYTSTYGPWNIFNKSFYPW